MQAHQPDYIREHGPLEIPIRILRFEDQIAELKSEAAWERGERVGKTLVKEGKLRVVLTLMHAGTQIRAHKADGATTIQFLTGHAMLHVDERHVELVAGEMAALDAGIEHGIEAIEESAFLLTIAQ